MYELRHGVHIFSSRLRMPARGWPEVRSERRQDYSGRDGRFLATGARWEEQTVVLIAFALAEGVRENTGNDFVPLGTEVIAVQEVGFVVVQKVIR